MLIPTDADRLGAVFTGQVEPVMPWVEGPDGKRRPGSEQERNDSGDPLWTVHAMVASGERPTLIAVRVPARECPQPAPFSPALFERLEVNARLNRDKQLVMYWSAAGVAEPRRAPKGQDQPAAA